MDRRLYVLYFTIFIDLVGFGIFIPVMPLYARELQASESLVGDIGALFSLMMFIFTPFWGAVSDRIGRKPVILIAVGISAVSYLIFAQATSITLLVISRMLTGVGAGNITAAQAYITDITRPEQRAKAMGMVGAAFGLGFIFGPPMGSFLYQHLGVEWVGYAGAIFCVVNLIAVLFLPESLQEKITDTKLRLKPITGTFRALKDARFRDLYIISFIYIGAMSIMQVTVPFFWTDDYGLTKEEIGWMFALVGVSAAVVQGTMIGLLGRIFGENNLMIAGSILLGIGLAMIAFIPPALFLPLSIVSIALLALGNGCLNPTILAQLSKNAQQREQGMVLGTNQSFGSLARIVGPALGGRLYEVHHGMPYISSGIIMLGGLYYVYGYRRRKRQAEDRGTAGPLL